MVSEEDDGSLLPQEIFVMGADLNLHSRSLMEVVSKASLSSPSTSVSSYTVLPQVPQPQPPSLSELGLLTESGNTCRVITWLNFRIQGEI